MTNGEKVAAVQLRNAAGIMERGGWVGGLTHNYTTGAHCAIGALQDTHAGKEAFDALAEMVTDFIPEGGIMDTYNRRLVRKNDQELNKIAAWSNMVALTAPSVACVMRATAQWLEEKDGNE